VENRLRGKGNTPLGGENLPFLERREGGVRGKVHQDQGGSASENFENRPRGRPLGGVLLKSLYRREPAEKAQFFGKGFSRFLGEAPKAIISENRIGEGGKSERERNLRGLNIDPKDAAFFTGKSGKRKKKTILSLKVKEASPPLGGGKTIGGGEGAVYTWG